MMLSGVNDQTLIPLTIKKYLYKLRAYSGYFCGLILAQILAAVTQMSGSATMGSGSGNLNIELHIFSAQTAMIFTVVWALIISILIATQPKKDASFSFPGNRLSDCLSDFAYVLTGCLFGGLTTALFGAALRVVMVLLFAGNVVAPGFYPAISDLFTIAAVTALYMLLASAVGYFARTIYRISRVIFFVAAAILIALYYTFHGTVNLVPGRSVLGGLWVALFDQNSFAVFTMTTIVISALLFSISVLIANRTEVKE